MTAEPDVPQNHRRSQTAATVVGQALPLAFRQAGMRPTIRTTQFFRA